MRSHWAWLRTLYCYQSLFVAALASTCGCAAALQDGAEIDVDEAIVAPDSRADFTVWSATLPARLTITPSPAQPNAELTLSGDGFAPGQRVKIKAALPLALLSFYTNSDADGRFTYHTKTSSSGWYRYYALQKAAGEKKYSLVAAAEVTVTETPTHCGDGVCQENCNSCAQDCGACPAAPTCGDGRCDATETCTSCSGDCGNCPLPSSPDGGVPGVDATQPLRDSTAPGDSAPVQVPDLGTVPGTTYYASPQGGGSGKTKASPFSSVTFGRWLSRAIACSFSMGDTAVRSR